MEEVKRRNEMEEILASSKKEVERMNKEHDKLLKELHRVHEQKSLLERKASESRCDVEELEKKMFAAVDLLVSFKEKRDKLQIEQEDATNELRKLKNMVERESSCNRRAEMPTFSFMEIIEATRNFDPSWKIGEGRHGSVYKGVLRHMDVALKMFPSYGSHSQSTFQYEVNLVLKRIVNKESTQGEVSEQITLMIKITSLEMNFLYSWLKPSIFLLRCSRSYLVC